MTQALNAILDWVLLNPTDRTASIRVSREISGGGPVLTVRLNDGENIIERMVNIDSIRLARIDIILMETSSMIGELSKAKL